MSQAIFDNIYLHPTLIRHRSYIEAYNDGKATGLFDFMGKNLADHTKYQPYANPIKQKIFEIGYYVQYKNEVDVRNATENKNDYR